MNGSIFPGFPVEGLKFLRALKRNNTRDWFQARKHIYEETLKKPMEELVFAMADAFADFAPEMAAHPKISTYRIYRDTRFSKDKTPYKTHTAAVFPRQGLDKHAGAGFYFHFDGKELLIGGGLYMPLPDDLKKIRAHIASHGRQFRSIVESSHFTSMFGSVNGEKLSRMPQGYAEDHPMAEYLKYKQFLAGRTLDVEIVTTPKLLGTLVETFKTMTPMVRFINEPLLKTSREAPRLGVDA